MKTIMLILVIYLSVFSAKAQQRDSTYKIKAKVISISKIEYYLVIKAVTLDSSKRLTILSKLHGYSGASRKRRIIQNKQIYYFTLQSTAVIQISKGRNLFVNLRALDIGHVHLLDSGELPFVALNMNGPYIYDN